MLTEEEARHLIVFWGLCSMLEAIDKGLELLPELD